MFEADEELNTVKTFAKRINILDQYRSKIALEGMSRDVADTLTNMDVAWSVNSNKFTRNPGPTYQSVALEDIDWVKTAAIVTIIGAVISMLRKFYKWLNTQFGDVQTVMEKRASEISDTAEKVANAAANARAVEPGKSPSYEEGVLYRRLKAEPDSKLNPIFEVMIGFVKSGDKSEIEVKRAMEVLSMLYKQHGDKGMALYATMALDKDGRYFTENLNALKELNRNGGDLFNKAIAVEFLSAVTTSSQILYSLSNIVFIIYDNDDAVGRAMSRTQEGIEGIFRRQVHDDSFMDYAPLLDEMPTMSDGREMGHVRYTAYLSKRGQKLVDFVTENENKAYSIWPDLDHCVFPSKNPELVKGLMDPNKLNAIEDIIKLAYDTKYRVNYSNIKKTLEDIDKDLDKVAKKIETFRNTREGLRPIEFDVFSKYTIVTSPQEYATDMMKFITAINAAYGKYWNANRRIGSDIQQALTALGSGAEFYESILKRSLEKQEKENNE